MLFTSVSHPQSAVSWVINDETSQSAEQAASGLSNDFKKNQDRIPVLSLESFKSLEQAEADVLRRYKKQISQHWSDVQLTNRMQWVSYSQDWQVRKRTHFEKNIVDISVTAVMSGQSVDFKNTNLEVERHLRSLLETNLREAVLQEPTLAFVSDQLGTQLFEQIPDVLVFSELFSSKQPKSAEIKKLTKKLMGKAQLAYDKNLATKTVTIPLDLTQRLTYTIPLPSNRLKKKAREYRPDIVKHAQLMKVPTDLVYAIIHTESHFNPLARSPIPAYGLMQIVPRTAGLDATKYLYQESKLLSPTYLYNPTKNIEVGAAYLNVLYYHYLKKIENPKSRLYCTIAAYNTGATNVAKAFGSEPKMSMAIGKINKLSANQVLAKLLEYLPSMETRNYIKKVLARKSLYSNV